MACNTSFFYRRFQNAAYFSSQTVFVTRTMQKLTSELNRNIICVLNHKSSDYNDGKRLNIFINLELPK